MFCSKCGNSNSDDSKFCNQCGTPLENEINNKILKDLIAEKSTKINGEINKDFQDAFKQSIELNKRMKKLNL
jgi:uncharacterized membrane protein YvbJ